MLYRGLIALIFILMNTHNDLAETTIQIAGTSHIHSAKIAGRHDGNKRGIYKHNGRRYAAVRINRVWRLTGEYEII